MTTPAKAEDKRWIVLRVTYNRVPKVKDLLDAEGVENFIPMTTEIRMVEGKRQRRIVPLASNYVFVHETFARMDVIKRQPHLYALIRYNMNRETQTPMVVPDRQMAFFMAVAGHPEEAIEYLQPELARLKKGDRVRITSGLWTGVEGRLIRFKKNLRVLVEIEGVMAVATVSFTPSMFERIDE